MPTPLRSPHVFVALMRLYQRIYATVGRLARLGTLVVLFACSGSGGDAASGSDSASMTMDSSPPPVGVGQVTFLLNSNGSFRAEAEFSAPGDANTFSAFGGFDQLSYFSDLGARGTVVGPCVIWSYSQSVAPDSGVPAHRDAGNINISGARLPMGGVTLVASTSGQYGILDDSSTGYPFDDGQTLTAKAAGGQVPAFNIPVVVPPQHASIVSPQLPVTLNPPPSIDRTVSIELYWPPVSGSVIFLIEGSSAATQCRFDGVAVAAMVPAAALSYFAAGDEGFIERLFVTDAAARVGDFDVRFEVRTSGSDSFKFSN